ncbi:hypothetical protein Syun_031337 [Stephania yunnanensis]|uniref:Uncharacterized protein n=1 Tax=Stephania yunnanensis TaxID=152371 RepID=A0AAP0HFG8_9MAGN
MPKRSISGHEADDTRILFKSVCSVYTLLWNISYEFLSQSNFRALITVEMGMPLKNLGSVFSAVVQKDKPWFSRKTYFSK